MSDIKAALGAKPTANSVAQLLRSLPGGAKASVEEQRVQWGWEADKAVREALLVLWVYLFADVDEFVQAQVSASRSHTSPSEMLAH